MAYQQRNESGEMKTAPDRKRVNKAKSGKRFNREAKRTKGANLAGNPMRGGIRL